MQLGCEESDVLISSGFLGSSLGRLLMALGADNLLRSHNATPDDRFGWLTLHDVCGCLLVGPDFSL